MTICAWMVLVSLSVTAKPSPVTTHTETRLFELREYFAAPGQRDALHARFRDHTLRLHEKHGITNIAYFTIESNHDSRIFVLLAYPDAAARQRAWEAFVSDPEWQQIRKATDAQGRLVERIREFLLYPTPDCPRVISQPLSEKRKFDLHSGPIQPGQTVIGSWSVADSQQTIRLVVHDAQTPPVMSALATTSHELEPLALIPTVYSPLR